MRSSTPAQIASGLRAPVHLVVGGRALRRQRDRRERARLGHAPGLDDADAVARLEALHQRARHRRAAAHDEPERREVERGLLAVAQHVVPDRRHRRRDRRLLARDHAGERRGLQMPARQHEVGADLPRGVRQAPGVGVEHRHDQQHAVAVVQRVRGAARDARASAARSSGGCRPRPSGCRWCRSCSTWPPRCARRSSARRSRGARRRGALRSAARPCRARSRRRSRPRSRARRSSADRAPWRAAARASPRRSRRGPRRGSRCRRAARGRAGC